MMSTRFFMERENRILKILLRDGFFWMDYESRDCDGLYSYKKIKFTSLEEFYDEEDRESEWADGPFSFDLAAPNKTDFNHN